MCYAYDPVSAAAMRGIDGDGAVKFGVKKGEGDCHYISSQNLSQHRP